MIYGPCINHYIFQRGVEGSSKLDTHPQQVVEAFILIH